MSAVPQEVGTRAPALKPGQAVLKGRVVARSRAISTQDGRRFLTVVALPAPDEFTSPSTVELRSREALGQSGDAVSVVVQIGGFRRSFDLTDQVTGEKVKVQSANNTLDVLS